ncbi:polysaccharide pyruvyl transferase family protein [Kitasatospora sp. NPDC092948]|uniref:polysaccharide pyruvyl transferase family protein n=1 Tax=Kitasatospora sp. NPDC092948 TaxID=3364088 RepID=UPI003810DBFC
MKVVVVNAFARGNRGDAALLSVALQQVAQAYPGAQVRIAGFEHPDEWPDFDGVPNLGSIRRYVGDEQAGRLARPARKLLALLLAGLAALPGGGRAVRLLLPLLPAEMRAETRALAEADLVLSLGGGYLNGKADFASDLSIGFLLLPLWLAQRFGVPVVLAPQSYGPFPTRTQAALMRKVVGASRRVVAREEISVARLAEAGVPDANLVRGVDSAFAFTGLSRRAWRQELAVPADAELVLVTARRFLDPEAQDRYEAAMAGAVRHLLARGCHVVLVPQVTCTFQADDDRIVNRRIAALLDSPRLHLLDDASIDHHDIFALYGAADFILGTRFHSVIFGLVSGVPCAAVEYDHKTRGIMADLGLEHWVVRMTEATTGSLVDLVDRLLAEGGPYRAHLGAVLPAYSKRAAAFVEQLRADVPGEVRR